MRRQPVDQAVVVVLDRLDLQHSLVVPQRIGAEPIESPQHRPQVARQLGQPSAAGLGDEAVVDQPGQLRPQVLDDMGIREGIKAFSNWPTIPQLYVKGEFVGGCDIVREMFQQGELQQLLDEKGIGYDDGPSAA